MKSARAETFAYALTVVVSLALTQLLAGAGRGEDFGSYFGAVDPRIALAIIAAAGAIALAALRARGWRPVVLPAQPWRAVLWLFAAAPFAAIAIGADLLLRFPREMNVVAPWSLGFYPVMAFIVEVVFHAAPLALLALALGSRPGAGWRLLAPAALIEPVFQLIRAVEGASSLALDTFVFAHVFAFNLVELFVFRRHGFLPAWGFRVSYYLIWHILWGHLRLL